MTFIDFLILFNTFSLMFFIFINYLLKLKMFSTVKIKSTGSDIARKYLKKNFGDDGYVIENETNYGNLVSYDRCNISLSKINFNSNSIVSGITSIYNVASLIEKNSNYIKYRTKFEKAFILIVRSCLLLFVIASISGASDAVIKQILFIQSFLTAMIWVNIYYEDKVSLVSEKIIKKNKEFNYNVNKDIIKKIIFINRFNYNNEIVKKILFMK